MLGQGQRGTWRREMADSLAGHVREPVHNEKALKYLIQKIRNHFINLIWKPNRPEQVVKEFSQQITLETEAQSWELKGSRGSSAHTHGEEVGIFLIALNVPIQIRLDAYLVWSVKSLRWLPGDWNFPYESLVIRD